MISKKISKIWQTFLCIIDAYGVMNTHLDEYVKKEDAVNYVLENHYDEIKEAVFEMEAQNKS